MANASVHIELSAFLILFMQLNSIKRMYGLFATQTMAWVAISIACLYYPPPAAASFILATITAYKKKKN